MGIPILTPDVLIGLASGVLGMALLAISVIDARTLRIPDAISLPLVALGLGVAAALSLPLRDHLIGAVAGYGMLALLGAAYFRRTGTEGLGLGDAKLFSAAGAWLGWQGLPPVLLIAALGGLFHAVTRRDRAAIREVAFGPWLALGFWLVWLWRLAQTLPIGL